MKSLNYMALQIQVSIPKVSVPPTARRRVAERTGSTPHFCGACVATDCSGAKDAALWGWISSELWSFRRHGGPWAIVLVWRVLLSGSRPSARCGFRPLGLLAVRGTVAVRVGVCGGGAPCQRLCTAFTDPS